MPRRDNRDAERHDIHDIVVVSHGVTIRAFVFAWIGYLPVGRPRRADEAQERREAGLIGEEQRTSS